ncbi:MAG: dephospho-CoA kinase [Trichodesmium sp. St16_bin4-tuft]|uniref:Dephospho-CoA kinase n=1 Tax=Trichodesmium erythraeum (strain IMS101) TaxID=203124 RepID=Q119J3_TRIEI|nr:dephospho-CoA kinase [Trichodesmium erythraeum GBRTRLIN201]MCH2046954.1 dephospho-CoA kinase [Trichodesmium sp. ALOHA_ZT_67]MCL2927831.1 dephospho-CoA kinase [Trichodesmium sp. MAG_R01]MDE5072454.1 dephospho-CoA kinase [Trichodesmium sp. St5_bin8]MDE5079629.1 dephospho-CoA kinase [Trichodesmium sp. St2_bin6]MDE5092675.1 dephospho-CoA kinase [Trichodesmium sp. St18_bin3_1_1]MDE5098083.1 dephospho-CoA kinase [Trichodesmium sp. St16_bin4-tuft]MDE5103508.1 dephospho-CoA kinase [Trichodesmium 
MRLIGLTGGISTGKTTVSNYLSKNYQFPIWDADVYGREAVKPGSSILKSIVEHYGQNIVLPNGNLDRRQLGEIVFNDQKELLWLQKQIHPYVRDRFEQNIKYFIAKNSEFEQTNYIQVTSHKITSQDVTAVLVIPLLFEAKMTDLVTEIWVIYAPFQQQIERLMKRDCLTQEQAYTRINNQMSLSEKCQKGDIVVDNSSTLEALLKQVDLAIAHQ